MWHLAANELREFAGETGVSDELLPPLALAGGVPTLLLQVHGLRARMYLNAGRSEEARAEISAWGESLRRWLERPERGGAALTSWSGEALARLADAELVQQTYELLKAFGHDHWNHDCTELPRGRLAIRLGLLEEAESDFREGAAWCERVGFPVLRGACLWGLADVAAARSDRAAALDLLGEAIQLFETHGHQLYLRRALARRQELLEERSAVSKSSFPDGLSVREVEVLRLVAGGKSSAEIGEELVIASNTVARHVSNILNKTGLSNRTEAAAYAERHGLTS
jgi:DNA-binding CsgD family transcriptional regulator